MKYAPLLFVAIILTGCTDADTSPPRRYEPDQSKRQTYFIECLQALPAGPDVTKYNDWAEVVSECKDAAYYNALICVEGCK